ncbi:DUF2490 domain-containing protein [Cyclobacterium marinum]|uniref:DUF2490 domain-containing protein n=1 Tax=Cyclobacterium marinum TaxID=104 RepID=UPI0011EF0CDA|nr:DUF2490 domain-containing protein [Cyclobacterium marinum]MBI0399317.1 DUF2490 domain-containing protein [Cyclobacterium marinum]
MKSRSALFLVVFTLLFNFKSEAQTSGDHVGAWYMYFFNTTFNEGPWGFQGDLQYHSWNKTDDMEQVLFRAGPTYKPKHSNVKFTLGYANITFGQRGIDNSKKVENRIYQEILFPAKISNRFYTTHRFRYEQRFLAEQDFRTRFRYILFLNIPLNKTDLEQGALYLAFYDEIFLNGEKNIGHEQLVEIFDRNRTYAGLGYLIRNGLKIQLGGMRQIANLSKRNQFILSLHHSL